MHRNTGENTAQTRISNLQANIRKRSHMFNKFPAYNVDMLVAK